VKLNNSSPKQVYDTLTTKHPKAEARRYLQKVLYFQRISPDDHQHVASPA